MSSFPQNDTDGCVEILEASGGEKAVVVIDVSSQQQQHQKQNAVGQPGVGPSRTQLDQLRAVQDEFKRQQQGGRPVNVNEDSEEEDDESDSEDDSDDDSDSDDSEEDEEASGGMARMGTLRCSFCHYKSKGRNSKAALKRHMEQVHLGIRKFTCDTCGKALTSSTKLKLHIDVVHFGKKDFR